MKKRLVSGLLVGCMMLSLVACNKKDGGKNEATTKPSGNTVVSGATYDFFDKLIGRDKAPANAVEYKYGDFITLGDYKGVNAEVDTAIKEVTKESYDAALKGVLSSHAKTNQVKTGKTKDGDAINLDFKGLLNGEAFDNGTATNYNYTIGGTFIEDLDRGLIGLEVGKKYSIPCKFPSDYQEEKLKGKDVVFEVTVNYISETIYPELTDELAKKIAEENKLTDKFTTKDGLEKYLNEKLKEEAQASFDSEKFVSAWENVIKNCKFDGMPEVDYQAAYDSMVENAQNTYAQYQLYGYDWASFIKMYGFESEADFKKYCEESATEYVQTKLAMMAIADKEGIKVTKEEYEECAEYYVTYYEYKTMDELYEALGNSKDLFIEERYYEVIYGKVTDLIIENAKEVPKKTDDKEKETSSSTEKATEKETSTKNN